jgi:hypothetical protein
VKLEFRASFFSAFNNKIYGSPSYRKGWDLKEIAGSDAFNV